LRKTNSLDTSEVVRIGLINPNNCSEHARM
jgi:hypothetical protein